ncbi:MAG TPA: hypothetical protein VL551_11715 [Actinospica sp.]|jgi:hypothetical protein|nr:hypothetical protein [Actinospica sp.]
MSAEVPGPVKLTFAELAVEAREAVERVTIPDAEPGPGLSADAGSQPQRQSGASALLPLDFKQLPPDEQAMRATRACQELEERQAALTDPDWTSATSSRRRIHTTWATLLANLHAGLVEIVPLGWSSTDQYTNVLAMLDGLYAATGIPAVRAVGDALRQLAATVEYPAVELSEQDAEEFARTAQQLAGKLISIMRRFRKLLSWAPYEVR